MNFQIIERVDNWQNGIGCVKMLTNGKDEAVDAAVKAFLHKHEKAMDIEKQYDRGLDMTVFSFWWRYRRTGLWPGGEKVLVWWFGEVLDWGNRVCAVSWFEAQFGFSPGVIYVPEQMSGEVIELRDARSERLFDTVVWPKMPKDMVVLSE